MFAQNVCFHLRPGASRETFLGFSEQMLAWLQTQPGFLAYARYVGEGRWSDRIVWEDEGSALGGRVRFLGTEVCEQLQALVETDAQGFFGEAVLSY